ncbi:hypothetical protein [Lentibacillus saliphilus]|uniref:hypothetical protein n=1 Tax=Lentibacillus saliphilus TaxID=2737028 RepID=UPI001C30213F|nr:hypothetical protein [Lentibacillus saliphilus]
MLKLFCVTVSTILLFLSPLITLSASTETTEVKLDTEKVDLTGNNEDEHLTLKGMPLSDDSRYYQDLWVDIINNEEQWSIRYGGGYEPTIKIVHLKGTMAPHIYFKAQLTEDDHYQMTHHLHRFKDGKMSRISLPQLDYLNASITKQYEALIQTSPTENAIKVDLSNYKEQLNTILFDIKNEEKDKVPLWVDDNIAYNIIVLGNQDDHVLESIIPIKTTKTGTVLGNIRTLWERKENQWINVHTQWEKS